ncbi:MAG: type IV secretion system protein [Treponema sp.]|nr:type IV secretion system protein [Treponema sp.]
MSFDPTFTYALDYFDGLMGTFFPTVWRLAMVMALLGIAWSGVQIAFGTMEVRKGAVGIITKLALFWVVLACYPMFCVGIRTFAFKLGQLGGSETSNNVVDMVSKHITKLDGEINRLEKIKTGNANGDSTVQAVLDTYYKGIIGIDKGKLSKDKDDILEEINAKKELKEQLDAILPKGADGKRYLRLELVGKKPAQSSTSSSDSSTSSASDDKESLTSYNFREGLMSLDTVFKLALLSAQIMKEKEWQHDVLRASMDIQNGQIIGFGEGDKKLDENVQKSGGNLEDALVAAESVGKVGMTISSVPMKPFLRYIEVCACSIFLIVLTIVCLIQYAMQMVEYSIVTGFSIILIPLMLFEGTKDYAMKIIAMLFAEAVKLAMLVLMMYYNIGLFGAICQTVTSQQGKAFGLPEMSFVVFSAILGFALVSNAPKLASTIVTGQPQMSMGEFVGAAGAMGGAIGAAGAASAMAATRGVGGAVGLGKGVAAGVSAAKDMRAAGGGMARSFASGLKSGVARSSGNVLDALAGKGSGIAQAKHSTKMGQAGAAFREKSKTEAAQAKIAAKGVDKLNGTGNTMRKSSSQDSKAMMNAGVSRSDLTSAVNQVYGGRNGGGSGGAGSGGGGSDGNLANRHPTAEQWEKVTASGAPDIMKDTKDVTNQFI